MTSMCLLRHIRNERDLAGALDRRLQLALVLGAGAGNAPRQDLAALRHERPDQLHVLVVDVVDLVRAELADLAPAEQRAALSLFLVARLLVAGAAAPAAAAARSSLSEWHGLNLPHFKTVVVLVVRLARRTPFTRLPLRRQPALDAAALGVAPAARLHGIDDFLVLVDADDHLADDDVHDLEPAIQLLHQLAAAVDRLEDVEALLVARDFVGQALAAPVVGAGDLPVQPRHDVFDLGLDLGDLRLGRIRREDVDELV